MLKDLYQKAVFSIQESIYKFKTTKLSPSVWAEANIVLPSDVTSFPGPLRYDHAPYTRELLDCMDPACDIEGAAAMKCIQSGFTDTVVNPFICYTIAEEPAPSIFASGDEDLVRDTVNQKLDPVIYASGLQHHMVKSVQKKGNHKSADTDFYKEFRGGKLICITYKASKLRMYSVKNIIADELDNAKKSDKEEGSIITLLENRASSYGSKKKILYISSPTIKGKSNIEFVYERGDKRYWNWECPHCKEYIQVMWSIEKSDGSKAGMKWELDKSGILIEESVHYECQNCGGRINSSDKYNLNLTGKWVPTCKPKRKRWRSYKLNAIVLPPGNTSWLELVGLWLEACPPNEPVKHDLLKTFLNTRLGELWEDRGVEIKANQLQKNDQPYKVGVVPDVLSDEEQNGKIIFLSLVCDLGGIMKPDDKDVRLDWEVVAHTTKGITYRIDHGKIGTFKNTRQKREKDKEADAERIRYTYELGQPNSVWSNNHDVDVTRLIDREFIGQSGESYTIQMTLIDTGHFTQLAYAFIKSLNNHFVVGIKGVGKEDFTKTRSDVPMIKRSQELKGQMYLLQVNQIKEILASNMQLTTGIDGYQPPGFMNFPVSDGAKYTYRGYYAHYESEKRIENEVNGSVDGFKWVKKYSTIQNHYFDIAVYTIAAPRIFMDILAQLDPKSKMTWEDFCMLHE